MLSSVRVDAKGGFVCSVSSYKIYACSAVKITFLGCVYGQYLVVNLDLGLRQSFCTVAVIVGIVKGAVRARCGAEGHGPKDWIQKEQRDRRDFVES